MLTIRVIVIDRSGAIQELNQEARRIWAILDETRAISVELILSGLQDLRTRRDGALDYAIDIRHWRVRGPCWDFRRQA